MKKEYYNNCLNMAFKPYGRELWENQVVGSQTWEKQVELKEQSSGESDMGKASWTEGAESSLHQLGLCTGH